MKEESNLKYERLKGVPHIRDPGNSIRRNTGEWKVFRPEIDLRKCIRCKTCWLVCPESAISWTKKGPKIDYHLCKGCLVCRNECPVSAIKKKKPENG